MVIVLIGPSGCGKTTVGRLLEDKLGWDFYDGDDFHSAANIQKMSNGISLTDKDREPWLRTLAEKIRLWNRHPGNAILACSALKSAYRELLGIEQQTVVSVYLQGSFDMLLQRLQARKGHYMKPDLLASQLETMEEPTTGWTVSIDQTPEQIVTELLSELKLG